MRARFPRPIAGMWHFERAHAGEIVEFADTETEAAALPLREIARARGFRSLLYVPLMSKGTAIGFIAVSRKNPGSFLAHHVELLRTFADQAVIAIENVRLFNEVQVKTADLSESLQQQTATADVLKVISRSAFDLQTVLDTLVELATQLCGADHASIFQRDGESLHWAAGTGVRSRIKEFFLGRDIPIDRSSVVGRSAFEGRFVHLPDVLADPEYTWSEPQKIGGYRAALGAPLMRDGKVVGVIFVAKMVPEPFTQKQIELVSTFADQAVIAIENARLFNETKEALERQTATAEILKVIASSPDDVQPVFDAIAASANRLIGGFSTAVYRVIDDIVHLMAFTPTSPEADEALKAGFPLHRKEVPPLALVQNGETAQIADAETADPQTQRLGRARGWRSVTFTPLMSQGTFIGFIVCTRRETGVLADHHVQLLRTFADQAVIAIENARLFNETKEALERQTATAEILKVIASSPDNVQPVFEAIAERSNRLVGGRSTAVHSVIDDALHLMAFTRATPEADAALRASFPQPLSNFAWGERSAGARSSTSPMLKSIGRSTRPSWKSRSCAATEAASSCRCCAMEPPSA